MALRLGKHFKTEIAIQAGLDLGKAAAALEALRRLKLARQDQTKKWHATVRGNTCSFGTIPNRERRNSGLPGAGGRRLLDLLDQPMRGRELAEKLGVSLECVRQHLIALHAKGLVKFADPAAPFWFVMRADDTTPVLSKGEERVLSVIPREYTTDATKIRRAAHLPESTVQTILERLIAGGLAEALDGVQGQVYRITAAGLGHPQFAQSARRAEMLHLPVKSDRVHQVLSAIQASRALRIKELTDMLSIQHRSMNALMQYLKRKGLVVKSGLDRNAPYSLTEKGCVALAEMTRRKAA